MTGNSYEIDFIAIQSLVSNFLFEISELLSMKINDKYFKNKNFRKNSKINGLIDKTAFRYLNSIRKQNILVSPFLPFVWGLMKISTEVKLGDRDFYISNACACRMIDMHYYWINAKDGDEMCKEELKKRGWL